MIVIMLLCLMVFYAVLSFFIIRNLFQSTRNRIVRTIVISIFLFLPTWDVLLGIAVYIPMSNLWPKRQVHRTVKTDNIYYEIEENR